MKLIRILALSTIAFLLASCGSEEGSSESTGVGQGNAETLKIALVMKSLANEFFVNMANVA